MQVNKPSHSFYLFIAFLAMLGISIYLFMQNNTLKSRIDKFVPAAIALDNENKMLQDTKAELLQQLNECSIYRDSIAGRSIKASVQRGMGMDPSLQTPQELQPQQQQPYNPGNEYKDLNKNKQ